MEILNNLEIEIVLYNPIPGIGMTRKIMIWLIIFICAYITILSWLYHNYISVGKDHKITSEEDEKIGRRKKEFLLLTLENAVNQKISRKKLELDFKNKIFPSHTMK